MGRRKGLVNMVDKSLCIPEKPLLWVTYNYTCTYIFRLYIYMYMYIHTCINKVAE